MKIDAPETGARSPDSLERLLTSPPRKPPETSIEIEYRLKLPEGWVFDATGLVTREEALQAHRHGAKVECRALKDGKPIPPPTWMPWAPKKGEL